MRRTEEIDQPHSYGAISIASVEIQAQNTSLDSGVSKPPRAMAPDLLRGLLMVLQALDHCAVALHTWEHGVALDMERDGVVVDSWNHATAWTIRMLTHLCAPGFFFLLGMGIVYFGRSRHSLGWTTSQMAWHFAARAMALTLVSEGLTDLRQFWMMNMVLVGLAVDYLLVGLLWLAVNASEKALSRALTSHAALKSDIDESRQLLQGNRQQISVSPRSEAISWHIHNLFLLLLTTVTIWWNIWLSPDGGHCPNYPAKSSGTDLGPTFDFWFYPVFTESFLSAFPPLGWISFSIFGLLYGRLVLAPKSTPSRVTQGNTVGGTLLILIFVVTRLLQVGNLSEDCLRMPEQLAHPGSNQYLVSFRSFFYITKYPPDVAYFAFTMGVSLLLLAFFGVLPAGYAKRIPALMVFGKSALFFYAVHILLYFGLATPLKMYFGRKLGYGDPITGEPVIGVDSFIVYWITWAFGLAILYPLCVWYGRFKSTKGPNSIWRFF